MLFGRRRVDEDLERIRKANLPPDQLAAEEAAQRRARENAKEFTVRDIFSMTLAAFSIVLPYVAVFAAFFGLVYLVVKLMAGS
jgi:hypothetical protein